MRILLVTAIAGTVALTVIALTAQSAPPAPVARYDVAGPWCPLHVGKPAYVHDGDTVSADVHLPFKVTLQNQSLRAYGYDAWEVNKTRQTVKVTEKEVERGHAAREALMKLIDTGAFYVEDMTALQRDPYGRLLVKFWVQVRHDPPDAPPYVEWVDVARWMYEHGHCRPLVER